MDIEAVVFDMDGVIVDSELHWRTVESSFLREVLGSWSEEDQRSILGRSIYDIYDMFCTERGLTLSRPEFIRRYKSLADQIYGIHCSLIPGVKELLADVSGGEFRCGLASSSPQSWIDIVLNRFELGSHFDCIASGDHVPGKGKPEPDIYILVAQKLDIDPQRCVAIEDSEKGLLAAKRAGFLCLGFRNGFNEHQDLSKADGVITSFNGLDAQQLGELANLARRNE